MNIEIVTKSDLQEVATKLDQMIRLLQSGGGGEDAIYTTQQLATRLRVSKKTIENWRKRRLIEYSQIGNKIYFTGKAVESFLANHAIKRGSQYFLTTLKHTL